MRFCVIDVVIDNGFTTLLTYFCSRTNDDYSDSFCRFCPSAIFFSYLNRKRSALHYIGVSIFECHLEFKFSIDFYVSPRQDFQVSWVLRRCHADWLFPHKVWRDASNLRVLPYSFCGGPTIYFNVKIDGCLWFTSMPLVQNCKRRSSSHVNRWSPPSSSWFDPSQSHGTQCSLQHDTVHGMHHYGRCIVEVHETDFSFCVCVVTTSLIHSLSACH